MIKIKTYAEWCSFLEKYANGDDTVFHILQEGTFELDAGTTIRFYDKIQSTYGSRKKSILDKFNRELNSISLKSDSDFKIIFRNLNTKLSALNGFLSLKSIPDDLNKVLADDYKSFISNLKERFSKIFKGNIDLLNIIKSLGNEKQVIKSDIPIAENKVSNSSHRKIIF